MNDIRAAIGTTLSLTDIQHCGIPHTICSVPLGYQHSIVCIHTAYIQLGWTLEMETGNILTTGVMCFPRLYRT